MNDFHGERNYPDAEIFKSIALKSSFINLTLNGYNLDSEGRRSFSRFFLSEMIDM
jgi:hypothetical protein